MGESIVYSEQLYAKQLYDKRVFVVTARGTNRCLTSRANARTMGSMAETQITARQREILDFIESQIRTRGYPPSVREIGEAVGLTSPSTVH